ncbi:FMN-binding negative transcriptional regulator [Pelagibius marinus]|uniref:FMN-binding negative transcriptional regulator n=1 Tax=Pelagibius marinus TaxID=2762760 RepID=UPI001872733D|nr:FMN-binding negative transcriptional regulator [Pelagibius marinus]
MYVPEAFRLDDPQRIAAVVRAHDFALLVTAADGVPQATHLPFMYDPEAGEHGTLLAHMARPNPQWRDFEKLAAAGREALVIFQGPHSYISPTWYGEGPPNVPTWNYVAVHAYGLPKVIEEPERVRALLDRLVATQEAGLDPAWSTAGLTEKYVAGMQRGLVAFEIPVSRLEAKAKLSQNKTAAQLAAATAVLEAAEAPLVRQTGAWMRRALEDKG